MSVSGILGELEHALDTGDLARLGDLVPQLDAARPDPAVDGDLRQLRARAARVSRRLASAAEGVRAARWRLSEIRAMGPRGDRLVTYDGQGQRQDTGGGASLTRRL